MKVIKHLTVRFSWVLQFAIKQPGLAQKMVVAHMQSVSILMDRHIFTYIGSRGQLLSLFSISYDTLKIFELVSYSTKPITISHVRREHNRPTDRPTDRRTDRPTDRLTVAYRVACTRQKSFTSAIITCCKMRISFPSTHFFHSSHGQMHKIRNTTPYKLHTQE